MAQKQVQHCKLSLHIELWLVEPFPTIISSSQTVTKDRKHIFSDLKYFFSEAGNEFEIATEIKLATVTFQQTKLNESPFIQVARRPQSENQNSDFNDWIAASSVEAQGKLRSLGFKTSYVGNANDGVLCDHLFVVQKLIDFLDGKISFVALTDPKTSKMVGIS